eukprot:scaffold4470_cov255-Prasinococcus_capsulatus_cf.AAC.25
MDQKNLRSILVAADAWGLRDTAQSKLALMTQYCEKNQAVHAPDAARGTFTWLALAFAPFRVQSQFQIHTTVASAGSKWCSTCCRTPARASTRAWKESSSSDRHCVVQ